MAKVEFINEKLVRVVAKNGDVYNIGLLSPDNYFLNKQNDNYYVKVLSYLFDKHYDGTYNSVWNVIQREMYRNNLGGFFWAGKDDTIAPKALIGNRIKELRKNSGIKAKDLAEQTGIDAGNLSRIESGQYSVGFELLSKIARVLGCRVDLVPEKEEDITFTFHCGKNSDSFEDLEKMCRQLADKLVDVLDAIEIKGVPENMKVEPEIVFWTSDIPAELICVGNFYYEDEKNKYELDFSKTTL